MGSPQEDLLEKRSTVTEATGFSFFTSTFKNFVHLVGVDASPQHEQIPTIPIHPAPKLVPHIQPPLPRRSSLMHEHFKMLNIKQVHPTPPGSQFDSSGLRTARPPHDGELSPSKFHKRGSSLASQFHLSNGPESPDSTESSTISRSTDHKRSSDYVSVFSVPSLSHSMGLSDLHSYKESERLRRKHNCVRELYSTECQFAQDMAVIVRIYMCGSAEVDLSMRQISVLFSNVAQVLDVSLGAVAILDSNIPEKILNGDGTISSFDMVADEDLNVGRAMCLILTGQLYEVYEFYIHRSQKQMQLYYEMMNILNQTLSPNSATSREGTKLNISVQKLSAWLSRCRERVSNFNTAWSLESLLIKPIQRLGKYPLFLKSILECTDPEHRDFADLERAYTRSKHYLECVNTRFESVGL